MKENRKISRFFRKMTRGFSVISSGAEKSHFIVILTQELLIMKGVYYEKMDVRYNDVFSVEQLLLVWM